MSTAKVDGQVVKVGDFVSFKSDIEQGGKIIEIKGGGAVLVLSNPNGFSGEYIRGETVHTVRASDCWIE